MVYGFQNKISFETITQFIQWICSGIGLTASELGGGGGCRSIVCAEFQHATLSLQVLCVTDRNKSASAQIQWENI